MKKQKVAFFLFAVLLAGCIRRLPATIPASAPAPGEIVMYRPLGVGMVLFYFLDEEGTCLLPGNFDNLANGYSTLVVKVPEKATVLRLFINRPEGLAAREIRVSPETRVFVDL